MTTVVVPGLSFGSDASPLPEAGQLLLITDHLASPADFILHRTLTFYLKNANPNPHGRRVILVSLASEFAHWRAIAAKSNVNLGQHLKAGSLTYVDGLSLSAYLNAGPTNNSKVEEGYIRCHSLFGTDGEPSLKGLYDVVAELLRGIPGDTVPQRMVILDDITLLELIGVPSLAVTRFIRAVRAICRRHSAALIIRAHASPETGTPFDTDVLRSLVGSCHAHVEVRPLTSGKSGAVSGEISVHDGGLSTGEEGSEARKGRKSGVQYRLSDGGTVFFQKGMGGGVL